LAQVLHPDETTRLHRDHYRQLPDGPTLALIGKSGGQLSTQRWWSRSHGNFEYVASLLVRDECGAGNPDAAARRLGRIEGLELLLLTPAAVVLAEALIRPDALPRIAADDALHIAICADHRIPFLLTWNFRHIANATIRETVRSICLAQGFVLPTICTPDEL